MEPNLKKILRALSLELRHILEGAYDDQRRPMPGDLDRRLNQLGVWRDRPAKSVEDLPQLSAEDRAARAVVDGYLQLRAEAGVSLSDAVGEFVRESAYTWANRLLTLRCMEARGIIDEVILQKDAYAGRSLVHHRFAGKNPGAVSGEDDGLFAVLFDQFAERARELPELFDPASPAVALRPSPAALKRCIALLSGKEALRSQAPATDEVFAAPDALGWTYQYYQADEKDRVDGLLKTKKGFKCEGADIVPKTSLYTESYIVKFLVQNSLGATWMGMHPESPLAGRWEYFVRDADRVATEIKPVNQVTFLDPACGSGHFLLEAFDLFYAMYEAEGHLTAPREIAASILNENLFGIDIDGCAVQIAHAALWMKAREKAPDLAPGDLTTFHHHLVATNIRLPKGVDHIESFLEKHPEDQPFRPALEVIFASLGNAPELGSLLKLEEPLDRRMRELKADYDRKQASGGIGPQLGLYGKAPVQHRLPVGTETYEAWRDRVLAALIEHFAAESRAADPAQGFFGESAGKGLILADLLRRRYDVVAANPPYMGSNSMGAVLKSYVEAHYAPGKRDLYAAFVLRCLELTEPHGRLAMVTQHSWLFLSRYSKFRTDADGILSSAHIEALAHLGSGAFSEISGQVVSVALFVAHKGIPLDGKRILALRLDDVGDYAMKVATFQACVSSRTGPRIFQVLQESLRRLPGSPLTYFLGDDVVTLLLEKRLFGDECDVLQGLASANDDRFLRFRWELCCLAPGWFYFSKGGGFQRWAGSHYWIVDWRNHGIRIKSKIDPRTGRPYSNVWMLAMAERDFFYRRGLTYTKFAQRTMDARVLPPKAVFGAKGSGLYPKREDRLFLHLAYLNSRFASFVLRALVPGPEFSEGYVRRLPLVPPNDDLSSLGEFAALVKGLLRSAELTEPHSAIDGSIEYDDLERAAAYLAAASGECDRIVLRLFELEEETKRQILSETGTPAGWYPMLRGYDRTDDFFVEGVRTPEALSIALAEHPRRELSAKDIGAVKRQLRSLFTEGPKAPDEDGEDKEGLHEHDDDEESDESTSTACIPIPPETFLEELSQKLQVHPISVYWLLKELRGEGVVCVPERKRFNADRFSVMVLRLLGHRWPKQIEASEPVPDWADRDGVIPITEAAGEQTLVQRLRQRIAEDFPDGNVQAIEREFEEFVGTPLEAWLSDGFVRRHVSQFKKRPIAWQLTSTTPAGGRRKGPAPGPVFSCLVYCHKLDGDLLPKIRSQYIGTMRGGFQTELTTLEGLRELTAEQDSRKVQLANRIDELKSFDEALAEVIAEGFGTKGSRTSLRQYAIDDATLCLKQRWLRRLAGVIEAGPLVAWRADADEMGLHTELSAWVAESMAHLHRHCSAVGPAAPESPPADPDAPSLAALIGPEHEDMVGNALHLACDEWRAKLDEAIVKPLKAKLKALKEEDWQAAGLWDSSRASTVTNPGAPGLPGLPGSGGNGGPGDGVDVSKPEPSPAEVSLHRKTLQAKIKRIEEVAGGLAARIREWTCPEAAGWREWLASQPMYDEISSVDGLKAPPRTVADFVAQEIAYVPDINDGVRVNIAPLQRAGLLAADVLASKDLDTAIADRADWRADERRWCREGKLPQPGWWKPTDVEGAQQ